MIDGLSDEEHAKTAVLVTAHGTPDTLDDLPGFLTNIRRGRPAPPDVLAEVRRRYERIGGRSPLGEITETQAQRVGEKLGVRAAVAMRLWRPYPKDVLAGLYEQGVRRVISVPAAPFSVGVYHAAVREAAKGLAGLEVRECEGYGAHPALARAWAEKIEKGLRAQGEGQGRLGARAMVLFTAHSLPTAVVARGDKYPQLVEACVRAVVQASEGLRTGAVRYALAYQSQGMTNDEWLGPDLASALREAKEHGGTDRVLVCPLGFLADHVEVLYDLDVEAVELGKSMGVEVSRTEVLNDSDGLAEAMADAARGAKLVAL